MNYPLVSIIIPTYNRADVIGETLDSVALQTYQNWECIIIDDRSIDNTYEIIENYLKNDSRFKFIKKDFGDKGASASRNLGLKNANGKYIQFLDSDDILHPEKIEHQINLLIKNDTLTISTCKWERIQNSVLEIKEFSNKADYQNYIDTKDYFDVIGKYGGFFPPEAYLISREIIDFSGHWNENLTNNDDGEFFFRIISNASKMLFVENSIVYHRNASLNHHNLSELNSDDKIISLINSWKIIEALYVTRYGKENSIYIAKKKEAVYNSIQLKYKHLVKDNKHFFKTQIKNDNFVLKVKKIIKKIKLRFRNNANRLQST
ncbi:glycosyltransferase family 2 protein [Flavobacterium sp. DGU38]|uniref:Glycosyltransferase family 2 protein n=1 Tax=Flavobacterium calami TaxID=3139144 RepID=A0ABU9IKG1_9FLAO